MKLAELEDRHNDPKLAEKIAYARIIRDGKPVHYGKLIEDIKRMEVDENGFPLDEVPGNQQVKERITANLIAKTAEEFITLQFHKKNEKVDLLFAN